MSRTVTLSEASFDLIAKMLADAANKAGEAHCRAVMAGKSRAACERIVAKADAAHIAYMEFVGRRAVQS